MNYLTPEEIKLKKEFKRKISYAGIYIATVTLVSVITYAIYSLS
jgi:hypothetical protein